MQRNCKMARYCDAVWLMTTWMVPSERHDLVDKWIWQETSDRSGTGNVTVGQRTSSTVLQEKEPETSASGGGHVEHPVWKHWVAPRRGEQMWFDQAVWDWSQMLWVAKCHKAGNTHPMGAICCSDSDGHSLKLLLDRWVHYTALEINEPTWLLCF